MLPGLCPPATPPPSNALNNEDSDGDGRRGAMQMEQPNALSLTVRRKGNFAWKEMGFTECSESCLGGEEEL